MNLKRCEKGHFYDVDKYASGCPHCAGGVDEGMNATVRFNGVDEQQGVTMPATAAYVDTAPRQEYDSIPTAGTTSVGAGGSLADLVNNVTSPDTSASSVEDAGVTQRFNPGNVKGEPVVGWLVCITGEDAGKSFELKSGRNFIGRASNMDVVLASDKSVSRDKHAIILYEPRKRIFLAQPGESRELFYVNEEVVLNTQQLNVHDKILVGSTELIFVPFCGENFAWGDLDVES